MGKRLPSEEKKWLRYYSEAEIEGSSLKESLFEAIHHIDDEKQIALDYFGVTLTYKCLYEQINLTAKAFVQNGIQKGDVVMLMLPTLPESIICFYALNKIGAIPNMIDVRIAPSLLVEISKKTQPKMLVVMTFYLKQLENVRKQLDLDKIILLRGCDSMPESIKIWYKLGEYFNGRRLIANRNTEYIFWPEFLKSGLTYEQDLNIKVSSDEVAVIFQTSGTTGFPKCVMHVNETLNDSAIKRLKYINNPSPGDKLLSIQPIFTLFGFLTSIHTPLVYGMTVVIVPLFKHNQMSNLIKRNKPNYIFSVPSYWEQFAKHANKIGDLSFIKDIIVAGEVMDINLRQKVNKILSDNNSHASIRVDYGMTETGGTLSLMKENATVEDSCTNGYSGIPLPYINVCIYDNDSEHELDYNSKGEICVQTPFALKEYLHDKTSTEELRRSHPDGSKWIHTGDLGYLTDKGHLYVLGRLKRMVVRYDGTKLFPIELETVIKSIDGIEECSVVPVADPNHIHGNLLFAFVVADRAVNKTRIEQIILMTCSQQLPVYLHPYKVRIIEEMPHNSMGKIDYRKLIEMI